MSDTNYTLVYTAQANYGCETDAEMLDDLKPFIEQSQELLDEQP